MRKARHTCKLGRRVAASSRSLITRDIIINSIDQALSEQVRITHPEPPPAETRVPENA